VASLRNIISHSLGPTTTLACAAISRTVEDICTTYAVVQASPDITADGGGRTVWSWTSESSADAIAEKRILQVSVTRGLHHLTTSLKVSCRRKNLFVPYSHQVHCLIESYFCPPKARCQLQIKILTSLYPPAVPRRQELVTKNMSEPTSSPVRSILP
jgi:hypothetical protein